MRNQFEYAENYAQRQGFALQDYFQKCIQEGNWQGIAHVLEDQRTVNAMWDALGTDVRFVFIAYMLVWARMEYSAVLGGMKNEDASLIFAKYANYAWSITSAAELNRLNLQYMRELALAVADVKKKEGAGTPAARCITLIQSRLYDNISIASLAAELNYSEDHLSKLFKKFVGVTIGQYIKQQRLEEAKRLLSGSNLSLAEIADSLMFCSQSYFTVEFKKYTDHTPQQYREISLSTGP